MGAVICKLRWEPIERDWEIKEEIRKLSEKYGWEWLTEDDPNYCKYASTFLDDDPQVVARISGGTMYWRGTPETHKVLMKAFLYDAIEILKDNYITEMKSDIEYYD